MKFVFFTGLYFSIFLFPKTNPYPHGDGVGSKSTSINLTVSAFSREDYGRAMQSDAPQVGSRAGSKNNDMSINPFNYDPKVRPKCAGNSFFCDEKSDSEYPADYIKHIMSRLSSKVGLFTIDYLPYNLTQRNDVDNPYPLCPARDKLIYPTRLETDAGDWFFLFNEPGYKQGVRVEECVETGQECQIISKSSGIKTVCEQRYINRKLVALDGSGEPKEMGFPIPSCCMCKVISSDGRTERKRRFEAVKVAKIHKSLLDESVIVFPDELDKVKEEIKNRNFIPRISPGKICGRNGLDYCTNLPDYPRDHIKQLIKKNVFKDVALFGSDVIQVDLTTRFKGAENMLCQSEEKVIFPEALENKNKEAKYIVQDLPEYGQGIRFETCQSNNSRCRYEDKFPSGYKTACKQKFIYRVLMAIEKNGTAAPDTFPIPSCCSCHVSNEASGIDFK